MNLDDEIDIFADATEAHVEAIPDSALPKYVSGHEIASLLKISARAVRDMALEGTLPKASGGKYPLMDTVQAYCVRLRDRNASKTLQEEKLRIAREQADALALKNAQTRQELLPAAQVEQEWAGICRDIRAGCLVITARVQQQLPHLTTHDTEIIDSEIRNALQNLGNDHA